MKKKRCLNASDMYKALSLILLFGLSIITGTKAYGQSWSSKHKKKLEQLYKKRAYIQFGTFFNKVIAVSQDGMLIEDCHTSRERIISFDDKPVVYVSDLTRYPLQYLIKPEDMESLFMPGDTLAIEVYADSIPTNQSMVFLETAQAHYLNNEILSNGVLQIVCPDMNTYFDRMVQARTEQSNSGFSELKQKIVNSKTR